MNVIEDLERAVQLRAGARCQVAQGPQLVERRLAAALGLGGVKGLVVETILHAHPVTLLQWEAQQVHLLRGVAVSLLRGEPVKEKKQFLF